MSTKTKTRQTSAKENNSISELLYAEFEKVMLRIIDIRPIPKKFPRQLLTELYVARTILFASFTLGIRVGGMPVVYLPFREILGYIIIFVLTYFLLPTIGLNIAILHVKKQIGLNEYRAMTILWSFLSGLFSMVCNIHYRLADYGPPTYFMPVLVGLTVHIIGSRFDNNRKQLVGTSVGSATLVSFGLLLITGNISFGAIISIMLCTFNAIIALQLMIYDLIEDGENMNASITHVIGILLVMINFLFVTRLTGTYVADPSQNNVAGSNPIHSLLST